MYHLSHSLLFGRMSEISNRYWSETSKLSIQNSSKLPPEHLITTLNVTVALPVLKSSRTLRLMICNKPTPLYTTQYTDLFMIYKEGFKMLPGQRKPLRLPDDEKYDGLATQLDFGKNFQHSNKLLLPALNAFNTFATIDYKAHIIKIIDYSFKLVFKTKTRLLPNPTLFTRFVK